MRSNYLRLFGGLLILMVLAAVSADAQTRRKRRPVKRPVPQPTGAIKTKTGLTYIVTKAGTGRRAIAGDTVSVHYTGTLTNGLKFDSSVERGEPIKFPLGKGRVIKGWDEGIARMRVGGQAILIIPASIAYGERGAGGGTIPPGATLIFVVELVDAVAEAPQPPKLP